MTVTTLLIYQDSFEQEKFVVTSLEENLLIPEMPFMVGNNSLCLTKHLRRTNTHR